MNAAPGQNKQGTAEGILHRQALHPLRPHYVMERLEHQKYCAALIGLDAGLILGGDHPQGAVPVQGLVELTELSVPVDQQDVAGEPVLKVRRDDAVGRCVGVGVRLAVHSDR